LCEKSSVWQGKIAARNPEYERKSCYFSLLAENARKLAKLPTISRLVKIGLTAEQIAQVLDLPLDEVESRLR
jgi:hypothetical protein